MQRIYSLSTVILPHALAEMKRRTPSMKIEWHTALMSEMPIQILHKKVELSISALPVLHDHLHSLAFMRGRMVCVLTVGHRLAAEPFIEFKQLVREPLLLFRPDIPFGRLIADEIERSSVRLNSFLDFTNAPEAVALVKQGLGVTIIDEFVAQDSGLVVKPLKENIEFDVSFVYSRFEPVSESAHRMMHVLLSQADQLWSTH